MITRHKKELTVLIPSYNRITGLLLTLSSLIFQSWQPFDIIISNQNSEKIITGDIHFQTISRILRIHGIAVHVIKNLPRKGLAQQREFLLKQSDTSYSLFLDDDLILEPFVIRNLLRVIKDQQCGFVGAAPVGLSFSDDIRPEQQHIEFWNGKVQPENIKPDSVEWQRAQIHNAANLQHIENKYKAGPDHPLLYKVAWVGACVLYDTNKLKNCGGFSFWEKLPREHSGEDVLAQLQVMRKYGGCGIIPSGVYHQELPTTIPDRKINAPEYLNHKS